MACTCIHQLWQTLSHMTAALQKAGTLFQQRVSGCANLSCGSPDLASPLQVADAGGLNVMLDLLATSVYPPDRESMIQYASYLQGLLVVALGNITKEDFNGWVLYPLLVHRKWQLQEEAQELLLCLQGCSAHSHCSLWGAGCEGPLQEEHDKCSLQILLPLTCLPVRLPALSPAVWCDCACRLLIRRLVRLHAVPLFALVYQCKHAAQVTAHNIVSTLWRWSAVGYDVRQQVRPRYNGCCSVCVPEGMAVSKGRVAAAEHHQGCHCQEAADIHPHSSDLQATHLQFAARVLHLPPADMASSSPRGAKASLNLLYRSGAANWCGQASLCRSCLHTI